MDPHLPLSVCFCEILRALRLLSWLTQRCGTRDTHKIWLHKPHFYIELLPCNHGHSKEMFLSHVQHWNKSRRCLCKSGKIRLNWEMKHWFNCDNELFPLLQNYRSPSEAEIKNKCPGPGVCLEEAKRLCDQNVAHIEVAGNTGKEHLKNSNGLEEGTGSQLQHLTESSDQR